MTCPKCGGDKLHVYDVRHVDCESIWRRRECKDCGHRFSTMEYEVEFSKKKLEE